ncbi:MAG: alpha/beta fold hydrolase [Pseudomonadota bacterium]
MFRVFNAVAAAAALILAPAWAQETLQLDPEDKAEVLTPSGDSTVAELTPPDPESAVEARDPFALDTYRLRSFVCPFKGRVAYDDELTTCQMLEVPENRASDTTRMIEILVVTIVADEPEDWDAEEKGAWEKRPDPMIYLSGGPGGPAYGLTERFREVANRTMRDLILLDQRGTGFSSDFCRFYGNPEPEATNAADFESYLEAAEQLSRICFETAIAAGVDLQGYSNEDNALDVIALRKALGLETWNVWGISYGSTLALELLRVDAEGMRSSIIDGIAPVDYPDDFGSFAKYYARAIGELQDVCDNDPSCSDTFPDMRADIAAAIKIVSENPIVVEDALDAEVFPSGSATFFQDFVAGLPFLALYGNDFYPSFPAMVGGMRAAAEDGSLDERLRFLTSGGLNVFGDFAEGMSNAVTCQLGWNHNTLAVIDEDLATYPDLSGLSTKRAAESTVEVCEDFGLTPRPTTPLATDVPTFVANGQIDPITPPGHAEFILPGFSQAQYIEVPFAGHGPTADEDTCMFEVMRAFLDAPTDELDTGCLENEIEAPEFWAPLWHTAALPKLLADAADEGYKAAAMGGLAGLVTLSFLILTGGGVARVINPSDYSVGADMAGGRSFTWLAAALAVGGMGTVAYGAYMASESNPFTLLFGLPGYTRWGATAALVAVVPAALGLFQLVTHLFAPRLPAGTFFGTLITNAAILALGVLAVMVGFHPWAG